MLGFDLKDLNRRRFWRRGSLRRLRWGKLKSEKNKQAAKEGFIHTDNKTPKEEKSSGN
jgi:hypothetical protein